MVWSKVFLAVFFAGIVFFAGCLKNPKPELCSEILNSQIKDSCFFGVALDKKDASLCRQIIDSQDKDNCLFNLAQGNFFQSKPVKKVFVDKPAEMCENEQSFAQKDYCFHKEARAAGNEKLCYFINEVSERENCLEDMEKI